MQVRASDTPIDAIDATEHRAPSTPLRGWCRCWPSAGSHEASTPKGPAPLPPPAGAGAPPPAPTPSAITRNPASPSRSTATHGTLVATAGCDLRVTACRSAAGQDHDRRTVSPPSSKVSR